MTKRTRFTIFLILLILFILIAPIVILYSLGYRLDLQGKKLVQTGGLFLKIVPPSAEVFVKPTEPAIKTNLVGELTGQTKTLKKKTNFISGAVFIKNLFPQKYNVKIEKSGYYRWEKNLEILEGQVTEAKDIILIPENPPFGLISENIENFWVLPDESQMILKNSERDLNLFDVRRVVISPIIEKMIEIDFLDLEFSPDSKKALLKTESGKVLEYFVVNLTDQPPTLISLDFLGLVKEVFFNPRNSEEIFFTKQFPEGDFFFSANYIKNEISEPILADFLAFEINQKEAIWLNNKGFLLKGGVFDKRLEYLNPEKPFDVDENKEYQIISSDDEIFLQENNNLYYFERDSKEFKKIFENLKVFSFSPEDKKLMMANNYELWVLFLKDQKHQPYKKAGDKIFLARFSEKISQCFWFSTQYLIFSLAGNIKIAEIDDRDRINIVDLSPTAPPPTGGGAVGPVGPIEEIFLNQFNKKLYILTNDGNLYASEKSLR